MFYELFDVIAFFDVKGLKKYIKVYISFNIFNNAREDYSVGAW